MIRKGVGNVIEEKMSKGLLTIFRDAGQKDIIYNLSLSSNRGLSIDFIVKENRICIGNTYEDGLGTVVYIRMVAVRMATAVPRIPMSTAYVRMATAREDDEGFRMDGVVPSIVANVGIDTGRTIISSKNSGHRVHL